MQHSMRLTMLCHIMLDIFPFLKSLLMDYHITFDIAGFGGCAIVIHTCI